MASENSSIAAFIGSHASSITTRGAPAVCGRSVRRRSRSAGSWRCVLPQENAENDAQRSDGRNLHGMENAELHSEGAQMHNSEGSGLSSAGETGSHQVEGAVSLDGIDGLDAGLEEAFLKSLDDLELFSKDLDFSERSDDYDHDEKADVKVVDEEKDDDNVEDDGEADTKSHDEIERTTGVKAAKGTGVGGDQEGVPEGVNFLDTSPPLESDDAVVSINEAKAGKKGRARRSKTSKTTAKEEGSTSKKVKKTKSSRSKKSKVRPELTEEEMLDSMAWGKEPRWFFLQVKPGCEQSCAISIRNMAHSLEGLEVKEVLVPATKIMRLTKGGQSVKKEERIFPGYILVLMVMNKRNYADVQRVPNVQWFMGDPNRDKKSGKPFRPPLPVSDAEMKIVFDKVAEAGSAKPETKTSIRPGDSIEVLSGPFAGNKGTVIAVKPDLHIVSARLLMIGREAPVEFEIDQVKVVNDSPEGLESEQGIEQSAGANKGHVSEEGMYRGRNSESRKHIAKAGDNVDVASTADDLASVLADDRPEANDEFFNLFGSGAGDFSFRRDDAKRKRDKPRTGKSRKGVTDDELQDELSTMFDDEDEEDFGFLDEELAEDRVKTRSTMKTGQQESSKNALISSDQDLASFLSQDDDSDLWGPSEGTESASASSTAEKSSLASDKEDEVDDLFDFLDSDDEFEEASIIPDST